MEVVFQLSSSPDSTIININHRILFTICTHLHTLITVDDIANNGILSNTYSVTELEELPPSDVTTLTRRLEVLERF